MRRTFGLILAACLLLSASPLHAAQQNDEAKQVKPKANNSYKVNFTITESQEEKTVGTRHYFMLLSDRELGQVRAGNKVPIPSENKGFEYMDVGFRLDCQIRTAAEGVLLFVAYEIESFARAQGTGAIANPPVLRSINSKVNSLIQEGKPTIVSSLDDAVTQSRYELEVTVTRVP